jgi:hypothetical protein
MRIVVIPPSTLSSLRASHDLPHALAADLQVVSDLADSMDTLGRSTFADELRVPDA